MLEIRPSGSIAVPSFATRAGVSAAQIADLQERRQYRLATTATPDTSTVYLRSAMSEGALLRAGTPYTFVPNETSGNNPTLTVGSEGPYNLLRANGDPILAGDLVASTRYEIEYETPSKFLLVSGVLGTLETKVAGIEAAADVTDDGNVGSTIHGVTGKTTPVDADEMGLIDSAAANVLKKLTWANLKATLKTYLDTIYQPVAAVLTATTAAFTTAQETKLAGIEAAADVTDAGNVGSSIHGATAKTTPVDADEVALIDSAASNVLKRITWANVKAALNLLYVPQTRTITATGLVLGGGALSGDLVISVTAASRAETAARASTTRAVTPDGLDAALDVIDAALTAEINRAFANESLIFGAVVDEQARAIAAEVPITPLIGGARGRPGDAKGLFTSTLTGAASAALPLAVGTEVNDTDLGRAIEVTGDGIFIIVPRIDIALMPGQVFDYEFWVKRTVDSADPLNNAVQVGIAWLTSTKALVSETDIENVPLTVADGAQTRFGTVGRDAYGVDFAAPSTARYARPFVRVYSDSSTATRVGVVELRRAASSSAVDRFSSLLYRPGDALNRYTSSIEGGSAAALPAASSALAIDGTRGAVARLIGPDLIAWGFYEHVEESEETYKFTVARNALSGSMASNGVRLGVAWYDSAKAFISSAIYTITDLAAGDRRTVIRTANKEGGSDLVTPPTAYYRRLYVETLGSLSTKTDVEEMSRVLQVEEAVDEAMPLQLLNAASVTGAWVDWPGGSGDIVCSGTHDGETVTIEKSFDGGTTPFTAHPDAVVVADDFEILISLPENCKVRAKITGAGAGTSLTSYISRI